MSGITDWILSVAEKAEMVEKARIVALRAAVRISGERPAVADVTRRAAEFEAWLLRDWDRR